MRRYALRDDQWERIETFCLVVRGMSVLPQGTIGCLWRRCFAATGQGFLGETCRNASGTRSRFIRDFLAGQRAACGRGYSRYWQPMRTMNTL